MSELTRRRRLLTWLLNILVFAIIPTFLIYSGFSRIGRLHRHQRFLSISQQIEAELNELIKSSNSESFLVQRFWQSFYAAKEHERLPNIIRLRRELNNCFDFIAWNKAGQPISHTLDPQKFSGDWKTTLLMINRVFSIKKDLLKFSGDEETNFKKMFGPQAIPETFKDCIYEDNNLLIRPDVAMQKPSIWFGRSKYLNLFIFVKPEILKENLGLKHRLSTFKKSNFAIGYKTGSKTHFSTPPQMPEQLAQKLQQVYSIDQQNFQLGSEHFFQRPISEDLKVFAFFDQSALSPEIMLTPWSASTFFLILFTPYFLLSYRSIVLNHNLRFSLAVKLGLLFLFSGGLPLSVLTFVGYDYLNQKEFALYDEVHQKSTRYLQNFDERYESEFAHRIVIIQNALSNYLPTLTREGIVPASYFPFSEQLRRDLKSISDVRIYLIASSSKTVGTERMIYTPKEVFLFPGISSKKTDKEEAKIYSSIGRFILDSVNGEAVEEKVSTEVELLTESALQKNLYELQQEFIAADGKIKLFGLGPRNTPTYVDLISTSANRKQDFLLLIYWGDYKLERLYLERQFLNANRNISNLKIFACSENAGQFFPEELRNDRKLREYVESFSQKPHPPRRFIEINHQRYLIMGFRGKFMKNFCLFALYPAQEVSKEIYQQKKLLISAGIMAILILSLLGYLLVKSFIIPLKTISEGAEAIRLRDFDMRLPELGYDEFGDIARVFNETMVDFEELKVAGIVQEQLLPKTSLHSEQIFVTGKSVSMGDVGGDYYDYFNVAPGKTALIIGDVSGQGVGAALVMAMAKAAILQSQDLLEKPALLMQRLDEIVRTVGESGERRFMSLQYLCFDETTGTGIFTNAGGFSPLLVAPENRQALELKGSGPFLGALKRPRFSEEPFRLESGQALILYTDGLIETRGYQGKELGLNHFKDLVIEAYDQDAEVYCSNIFARCNAFSADRVSDDRTVVVMIRKRTIA